MDAVGRKNKSKIKKDFYMPWIFLVIAGLFEIAFATCLKSSEGFTKLIPSVLFLIFGWTSFYFLTLGMKVIPVGTAYAVWTGIGALGTAIVGILFFKESADFPRLFFLGLLIVSIIGLKLFSKV